ncbi:hypothetical protein [Pseudomonas sp. HY7a-MNA-CIBAN-0227]|uniref:hypothetical protein n=1 Tax=Pseudomonas sp. HY7a-MNA-CIBAN-0227 TaxID=3140474 RepID=UPI00332EA0AD
MSLQERLTKIQNGEIEYVGNHYINHEHNAHISKIIAIVGRTLVRNKDGVKIQLTNFMGYESLEVTGVGLDNNAVDLLSHACFVLNKTKNLTVNIDIIDYMRMTGLSVDELSNKPRFVKSLENSCDRMAGTIYKMKKQGVVYGSSIILSYKIDTRNNILTIVFNDAFNVLQNEDKIVHSLSLESKQSLKKEFSSIILDALSVNNYRRESCQEISYADLKWAVVSNTKKASHLKQAYNEAFAELVNKKFLQSCSFHELPNKQTVVRYKFFKGQPKAAAEEGKREPITIDQSPTVVDYDSLSQEGVMKALESTITRLGINPEHLDHLKAQSGLNELQSSLETDEDAWNTFDDEKFFGSKGGNDICDNGIPF